MLVVVAYDVNLRNPAGASRLRHVAKLCEKTGVRVQNSVFEMLVDQAQFVQLKQSLAALMDAEQDSIRFYLLGNHYQRRIQTMGKAQCIQQDGDLIL